MSAVLSTPKAAARGGADCTLSAVVPVRNEEAVLAEFHRRLVTAIEDTPGGFEVIYVDDGSTDGTPLILRQLRALDARIGTVRLSRNFGKEQAMSAGLREAHGAATVVIGFVIDAMRKMLSSPTGTPDASRTPTAPA